MENQLDISLGIPVTCSVAGNGRIEPGLLPAGRYATLIYTGVQNGIAANAALIAWAMQQGLVWDHWAEVGGDAFAARYESFLTDPTEEEDMAQWETEVAIKVADEAG